MTKTAIVLCGGMGKRLRPLTLKIPKPMIKVNGRCLIDYTLELLRKHGVEKIILACGYKWEILKEKYGDSVIYSVEDEPLGTAGAVKKALEFVDEDEFFVTFADDIYDVDLSKMRDLGANALCVSKFRCRFGIAQIDNGIIKSFEEKPILPHWANLGLSLLSKKIIDLIPDKGSMEADVYPKIEMKAFKHEGLWLPISVYKDISDAEKVLRGEKVI